MIGDALNMAKLAGNPLRPSSGPLTGWGDTPSLKRIVLVQDQDADSARIKQAFARFSLDIRLEHVRSANLAWELINCWSDSPSARRPVCILLDLLSGPQEGFWLLQYMQSDRRFRNLPVMVFSDETAMLERARLFSNVVGALDRPGDDVKWRRVISVVARLSQALPDQAGA